MGVKKKRILNKVVMYVAVLLGIGVLGFGMLFTYAMMQTLSYGVGNFKSSEGIPEEVRFMISALEFPEKATDVYYCNGRSFVCGGSWYFRASLSKKDFYDYRALLKEKNKIKGKRDIASILVPYNEVKKWWVQKNSEGLEAYYFEPRNEFHTIIFDVNKYRVYAAGFDSD